MTENPANLSIFILPFKNNFILHAPLQDFAAIINKQSILEIKKALSDGIFPEHKLLKEWVYKFQTTPQLIKEKEQENIQPEFLGIIPTRTCNSLCGYCDFGILKTDLQKMSLETAVACINWYTETVRKNDENVLHLQFFGGEPMLAPDVVAAAVHRTRLLCSTYDLFPEFTISTNGQYSGEWAHFLGNYFDSVVLSFDGPEEIQNLHRPLKGDLNSFPGSKQTADIISSSQAELYLRVCVSQKNVHLMENIARYFCETFEPSIINFEVMQETDYTKKYELFAPDPYNFASGFIAARDIAAKYGVKVAYASDITTAQWSSCPVGKDSVIVSPDGSINSCYLLPERWEQKRIDLTIGHVNHKVQINMEKIIAIRNMVKEKSRCKKCFCRWSCSGGCHVENTFPQCDTQYSNFCYQTRAISAATLFNMLEESEYSKDFALSKNDMRILAENKSDLLADWEG